MRRDVKERVRIVDRVSERVPEPGEPWSDAIVTMASSSFSGRLHSAAWRAGWMAGRAARGARELPGRAGDMRQRLRLMTLEASSLAHTAKEQVLSGEARAKARAFVYQNPLLAAGGVAVLSFCAGFAWRLLRSNRVA